MSKSIHKKEEMKTLKSMTEVIKKFGAIYHPSLFWENLTKFNLEQLQTSGHSNFKRRWIYVTRCESL